MKRWQTNVLGTVNLLQSIVDLDMEVYRVDVAGSRKNMEMFARTC